MQLQRLLELRDFFEREKEHKSIRGFILNDAEWLQLIEIVEVLEPFNKYTTKLQNGNCTLSDFFWILDSSAAQSEKPRYPIEEISVGAYEEI